MKSLYSEGMHLSVIVCTSPQRETNLAGCLSQLARQTRPADEILVIDDGSERGEAVISQYSDLPLRYFWRSNTLCVSQSRNQGAALAQGEFLVFIDSDIVLNPNALAAYESIFFQYPDWVFYSYFGNVWEYIAPSFFLQRDVIWCDTRFTRYALSGLTALPGALRQPHEWAWSANFAMSAKNYADSSGFDERFQGWGGEDLDFAKKLVLQGLQLHFFLDAWGEQQRHSHLEAFHTMSVKERKVNYISDELQVDYPVQVLSSERAWQSLSYLLFQHYYKKGKILAHPNPTRPQIVPPPHELLPP